MSDRSATLEEGELALYSSERRVEVENGVGRSNCPMIREQACRQASGKGYIIATVVPSL